MKKRKLFYLILTVFILFLLPVHANAKESGKESGKVYALLVSGTKELDLDQQGMQDMLFNKNQLDSSPSVYNFNYHAKAEISQAGKGTTQKSYNNAIDAAFKNCTTNDIAFFFHSGHGAGVGLENEGLLLKGVPLSWYKYTDLLEKLSKVNCKHMVVMIHSCYSGAVYDAYQKLTPQQQSKISIFWSSAADETSKFKQESISAYTTTVLDLLGYGGIVFADLNRDKSVTVSELGSAIKTYINTYSEYYGLEKQHPGYYSASNEQTSIFRYTEKLSLDQSKVSLNKGGTLKLTVSNDSIIPNWLIWTSSDNKIVTVDSNGNIRALAPGIATITLSVGTVKAECVVTVLKPSIKLNKTSLSLKVPGNYTYQLQAEVIGKSKKVIWKSSDPTVATVSSSGKVTAKDTGKANIFATANGVAAKCVVTVKNKTVHTYENGSLQLAANRNPVKISSRYFWGVCNTYGSTLKYSQTLTGTKTALTKLNFDEKFEQRFATNGSDIYYSVRKNGSSTATVYVSNLQTRTKKKVCTYQTSYGYFIGYYNGIIFLHKYVPLGTVDAAITSYDVKTKKYKTIVETTVINYIQYGRYFVIRDAGKGLEPTKLYIYNASTGTKTTISTLAYAPVVYDGKLYYVEYDSLPANMTKITLKCSNLTGTSIKSIASINTKSGMIFYSIGPKYAIIQTSDKGRIYTKITYSTKKKSKSDETEFLKLGDTYCRYV